MNYWIGPMIGICGVIGMLPAFNFELCFLAVMRLGKRKEKEKDHSELKLSLIHI